MLGAVSISLDGSVRFPTWPFKMDHSYAATCEFGSALSGDFEEVLVNLAAFYGDMQVTVLGLAPSWSSYEEEYHFYPGFHLSSASIVHGYGDALFFEPDGAAIGSLYHSLDAFAIVGSLNQWAVYGQRDWEIALLVTPDASGPWLDTGIAWFERDWDLQTFRQPEGWQMPDDVKRLRSNIMNRGNGQSWR